ncbi:MAG TPA: HlyD family efflux transporter periplasmic adaptor subunit [Fibrobacteria bacterium]|nr:HlyD family efflux transporter periplasmic adaptor subunit [Fibrobacteria bacterium]
MSEKKRKPYRKWILAGLGLAVVLFIGIRIWTAKRNALPEGIAAGNGRIEAKLVDVATKEPLKVREVLVKEGDLVKPGQVLVRLDTSTLNAELVEARANVSAVKEKVAIAQASVRSRKSEIDLARTEAARSAGLVQQGAGSQREYDIRQKNVATTQAGLSEDEARIQEARREVETAEASVANIMTRIEDATLVSPVLGRVIYRLTEPGEVLAAGGGALTLVDLGDVYMEIFLPSDQAAAVKLGSEGRIVMDYLPDRSVPAKVTFVSPEAQFTPKQVETKNEREMLMFRVKLQIPRDLVIHFVDQIKTGVRGTGYVKVEESAEWPERMGKLLTVDEAKRSASTASPEKP